MILLFTPIHAQLFLTPLQLWHTSNKTMPPSSQIAKIKVSLILLNAFSKYCPEKNIIHMFVSTIFCQEKMTRKEKPLGRFQKGRHVIVVIHVLHKVQLLVHELANTTHLLLVRFYMKYDLAIQHLNITHLCLKHSCFSTSYFIT